MAEGFASGFRDGFGLVNSVFDRQQRRREQDELASFRRDSMASEDAFRRQQLETQDSFNRDKLASDERIRTQQLGIEQQLADIRGELADITGRDTDSKIGQRDAQIGYTDENTRRLRQTNDRVENQQSRNVQAQEQAILGQQVIDYYQSVRRGDVEFNAETAMELINAAKGGLVDPEYFSDPIVAASADSFLAQIQRIANQQPEDKRSTLDWMNVVARTTNRYEDDRVVTAETHPYAPEWAHGMKIVGKEISDYQTRNGKIIMQTDVVVEDPSTGKRTVYQAPVTEGRNGFTEVLEFDSDQLFESGMAIVQLQKFAGQFKDLILRAKKETNPGFQDDNGVFDANKFQLVKKRRYDELMLGAAKRPEDPSEIPGMTNADVMDPRNRARVNEFVEFDIIDPYRGREQYKSYQGDDLVAQLGELKLVQEINRELGGKGREPLNRANLLELAGFLSQADDGSFYIKDKDEPAYLRFRNRITGRSDRRMVPPRYGSQRHQYSPVSGNRLGNTSLPPKLVYSP